MCIEKKKCVEMNFQCIYQAIGRINIIHGIISNLRKLVHISKLLTVKRKDYLVQL